jgi:lysophospholipase L1-like esterase
MNPAPSHLRRSLLVILVIAALLGTLELVSGWMVATQFSREEATLRRDRLVEHPFAVLLGWTMRPNFAFGDSTTHVETDANGHPIVPDPLPHPEFTVVVTGGSAMFGVGVTNNALSVPAQLQTSLRHDHGLAVNVVNLGARGYVAFQELLALNDYLARHPADFVLSVSGHHDITRHLRNDRTPVYILPADAPPVALIRRTERGDLVVANVIPALRRHCRTANLIAHLLDRARQRAKGARRAQLGGERFPATVPPAFLQDHLTQYAMMQGLCAVRGIGFALCLQPDAFSRTPPSPEEQQRLLQKDADGSPVLFEQMRKARTGYRAAFNAAPKAFPYADLAPAFGTNTGVVFRDSCHLNENGTSLLGRVLADNLAPRLRARQAAARPAAAP